MVRADYKRRRGPRLAGPCESKSVHPRVGASRPYPRRYGHRECIGLRGGPPWSSSGPIQTSAPAAFVFRPPWRLPLSLREWEWGWGAGNRDQNLGVPAASPCSPSPTRDISWAGGLARSRYGRHANWGAGGSSPAALAVQVGGSPKVSRPRRPGPGEGAGQGSKCLCRSDSVTRPDLQCDLGK